MNLIDGMPESPEEASGTGWEEGVFVVPAIAESIDVTPPVREGRRIVALRSSEAGVGPTAAVDARLRFMPTPLVLGSGEAASVVEAGSKDSLVNPLRPCTVGSQPFSLLWMLSLRPCPCFCFLPPDSSRLLPILARLVLDLDRGRVGVLSRGLLFECRWE